MVFTRSKMPCGQEVVNDAVENSVACVAVLAGARVIPDIPARGLTLLSAQAGIDGLANDSTAGDANSAATGRNDVSPVNRALDVTPVVRAVGGRRVVTEITRSAARRPTSARRSG